VCVITGGVSVIVCVMTEAGEEWQSTRGRWEEESQLLRWANAWSKSCYNCGRLSL